MHSLPKLEESNVAEIDPFSLLLLLGGSRSFGVMLIAHLNVKFLLTKEGKGREGVGADPHRDRGVKIKIARESLVGVATEARASCSGEHVVPCLPPCFSVTVCLKVCSFSRLVGFIFISPPHPRHSTADRFSSTAPPALPLPHPARFLPRRFPGSPTARPRSLERFGEGKIEQASACRKVCESEGESVSGPRLLILPPSQLVVRS